MQTTGQQPKQSDLQRPSTDKKAYHSPNLRAAGSIRAGTAASYTGTYPDGATTATGGSPLYTLSPF